LDLQFPMQSVPIATNESGVKHHNPKPSLVLHA
jgi:hypothetical protein